MGLNPRLPRPSGGDGLALGRWLERSLLSIPDTASTGDFGGVILPPVLDAMVLSRKKSTGTEVESSREMQG